MTTASDSDGSNSGLLTASRRAYDGAGVAILRRAAVDSAFVAVDRMERRDVSDWLFFISSAVDDVLWLDEIENAEAELHSAKREMILETFMMNGIYL